MIFKDVKIFKKWTKFNLKKIYFRTISIRLFKKRKMKKIMLSKKDWNFKIGLT